MLARLLFRGVIISSRTLIILLAISDGVEILCVGRSALADEVTAGASVEVCLFPLGFLLVQC